jgi:hypothetical protein
MTTFIPDTPDTASPTMSGKPETVTTETPTIIDFDEARKERAPLMERLPQRWALIAGLVGGSIALATTVTVVANTIVRRRTETNQVFGFRPVRRYGVRRMKTPRGGSAWVAYLYRTPDLRVRLPIRK